MPDPCDPYDQRGKSWNGRKWGRAGLCPITESNFGDGIFTRADYNKAGGAFGVGSDSNVRISRAEELRTLECSQRLRDMDRSVMLVGEG